MNDNTKRPGKHPLHSDLLEIAEIIEEKALFDVVTFARLKLACQHNESVNVFPDDWEATPERIKEAIHHALDHHPLIASSKFGDNGNE